jgi:PKD repeat protein
MLNSRSIFLIITLLALISIVDAAYVEIPADATGYARYQSANKTFTQITTTNGNGAGTADASHSPYLATLATTGSGLFNEYRRGIVSFNTSNTALLPSNAIIDDATLVIRGYSTASVNGLGNITLCIVNGSLTTNGAIASTDYQRRGSVLLSGTNLTQQNFVVGGNNTLSLNAAGVSAVSRKDYAVFFLTTTWDLNGATSSPFSWASNAASGFRWYTNANANPSYRPYLLVNYHLPDTTPPGAIQGLTNDTTTCEQITWDWQSPSDTDFNHTMIYRDGVFQYNLSNITYSDVWSGLTGGQTYEFESRTVDITGNVDTDWVNQSATPSSCTLAPIANFTANETTICLGDGILFNDTSERVPISWLWDFGDGNTSADQNVTYVYGLAGLFDVNLTATNSAGSDSEDKKGYITVTDCTGNPNFTANVTCQIGAPLSVLFTGNCEDPTYKNHWDFGDGNITDDIQSPVYIYNFTGAFSVSHSCKYGGMSAVFENKTDYIIVGVNGTYCTAPSGNCTTGDYHNAYAFPSTEVVTIGFLGLCGILVVGLIGRKE